MKIRLRLCLFRLVVLGLSVSTLAIPNGRATPLVTFDVIAVPVGLTGSSTPGLDISADGRLVQFQSGTHADVLLRLVATLNAVDLDLTNEAFIRTYGSLVTFGTTGDLSGAMRGDATQVSVLGVNNVEPFRGPGAKSGSVQELSNLIAGNAIDAISDIGGTGISPTGTGIQAYFNATSNSLLGTVGNTFVLGETILSLDGSDGSTSVRYLPRTVANSGAVANRLNVNFRVDGLSYVLNGDGARANSTVPIPDAFAFNSVTITAVPDPGAVPEPGAIGLLLGGVLTLFVRRRIE